MTETMTYISLSAADHPPRRRAASRPRHLLRRCVHFDAKQRLSSHLHRQANGGLRDKFIQWMDEQVSA